VTLRFHLTSDDIARVRVASQPDPLWEVLLSVHLLGKREGALIFDDWRRRTRPGLNPAMRPLFELAPPWGYSADFLTPDHTGGDIGAAIETVLSTPRPRLRENIDRLTGPMDSAAALRTGRPAELRRLGDALAGYHRVGVAPYRKEIDNGLYAERARLARAFLDGGTEGVLGALRPLAVWESPVLSLPGHPADRDVHLDGRGFTLMPAFFCWRAPTTLRAPEGPQVLVYPIRHDPGWLTHDRTTTRSLAALIGRTRAAVMEVLAETPLTTSDLARQAKISPASASEHATVLRDAGLLLSQRQRNRVYHTLTRLGSELLDDSV
jgi:DNA-binding transcriptional ArsR family regulator